MLTLKPLTSSRAAAALLTACSPSPQADHPAAPPAAPPPAAAAAPPLVVAAGSARAWAGTWSYREAFAAGTLTITPRPDDPAAFDFAFESDNGAHTGDISGRAALRSGVARYTAPASEYGPCQLVFRRSGPNTVTVEQPEGTCGAGAGVSFAGQYARDGSPQARQAAKAAEPTMLSLGILQNSQEDAAFRQVVGPDYGRFTASSQLISEEEDAALPGARVYDSFVRGLGSVMQNIVVIDPQHSIWAAVVAGDSILYYTSRPEDARRLPAPVEKWRTGMGKGKTLVYMSDRP